MSEQVKRRVNMGDYLAMYRDRLHAAYAKGFDSFLIYGPSANCPYSRRDFSDWWTRGKNDCKANKKPRF